MSAWIVAAIALLPPLALMVFLCARGSMGRRLAALQLAGSASVLELIVMTFAFGQASSIDLALMLGLLTLPATLLFAIFLERWL
jgi:multisubunit Na+/H+ antiporter MnhF subunit